jgi:hypothetical protein
MINPETQHFTAERMGAHARTRPVDHAPLVTAPEEVVDIIHLDRTCAPTVLGARKNRSKNKINFNTVSTV